MLGTLPSSILRIDDDYVAYCLDQAVTYFGVMLDTELEQAGHKPSKEERRAKAARETIIQRIFTDDQSKGAGFADPALMFK